MRSRITGLVLCVMAPLIAARGARAASFPATPSDQTGISGFGASFVYIQVAAPFQPYFAYEINNGLLPGYQYTNGWLITPGLYDPAVVTGYSGSLQVGSSAATNGVTVGVTNPITVKSSSFAQIPAGFTGANGTDELFDKITTMNATNIGGGNGTFLAAGSAASDRPASIGIVQSQSPSGNPTNDFPANSFFDIFADVTIPLDAGANAQMLYNTTPYVIQSPNITSIPPFILPFFTTSTTAPIYASGNNGSFWTTGEQIGTAYLGGPGTYLPEPASIGLLLLASAALTRRRRG